MSNMNLQALSSQIGDEASGLGSEMADALHGDLSNPAQLDKVQQLEGEWQTVMGLQSAVISDYKTTDTAIIQRM